MPVEIIEKETALVACRVAIAMAAHNMTAYELAKAACLPLGSVQKLCKGECERTSIWTLKAVAQALGISADYLLGLQEENHA